MFSSQKVGCANCVKPSDISYLPIFYSRSLRPRVYNRQHKKLNHAETNENSSSLFRLSALQSVLCFPQRVPGALLRLHNSS
jgi:hypothetical protein